jgi:hypothetical protein
MNSRIHVLAWSAAVIVLAACAENPVVTRELNVNSGAMSVSEDSALEIAPIQFFRPLALEAMSRDAKTGIPGAPPANILYWVGT